jgi:acyl carrier protein
MRALGTGEGLALLDAALARPGPVLVAARFDLAAAAASAQGVPPMLQRLTRGKHARAHAVKASDLPDFKLRLLSLQPSDAEDLVLDLVRTEAAAVLGLASPGAIEEEQSLESIGLDSLMAVELKNRISATVGIVLPVYLIREGGTVADLTRAILEQLLAYMTARNDEPDDTSASLDRNACVPEGSMKTSELLLLAARAGVKFWLDGDDLAYGGPNGSMTDKLQEEVILHRADIIAILQRDRLNVVAPIPRTEFSEKDDAPLASGQERLWLIERRIGASPLHNMHFRLQWKGILDREALALSLRDIVARHAALRTTFIELDGIPRAVVSPDPAIELTHLDLRDHHPDTKDSTANNFILAHQRACFDLGRGPLMRTAVITFAADDHILLVTQHHIITDGWSVMIFLTELGRSYKARCLGQYASIPAPPLTYSDYARWQHVIRGEQPYKERLTWWKEHLAGLSPLALPREDRPHQGAADHDGAVYDFSITPALASRLKDLAREEHCTLYTVLLTAWAVLLHRHANQCDFAVGTVTNGRDRMELQKVIGFFANTVVLRCDLSGDPSAVEAIARLRVETQSAFEHEVEFADVVLAVGAVRDASLTPLIQAAFIFENIPTADILNPEDAPGIAANVMPDTQLDGMAEGAKFDLALSMMESHGHISGCLRYAKGQFEAWAIKSLGEHFLVLLQSIVQNPHQTVGRLQLISRQEQRQLLDEWSDRDF